MAEHFLNSIVEDNTDILVLRPVQSYVLLFSNAGRGGRRNWFAITTHQIQSCLEDIRYNVEKFPIVYAEKQWRILFSTYLTDDVARTLAATQTLPTFEILAKTIHFANRCGPRRFKTIDLSPASLDQAIYALASHNADFTA